MSALLHLLTTQVICTVAARHLAGARWVWRAPRTGILLWQMLALSWMLCAVAALFTVGLSPYRPGMPAALWQWLTAGRRPAGYTVLHAVAVIGGLVLAAALAVALMVSWLGVLRARRRHRRVLAMVARHDPAAPGAMVLDHPLPVAYCLPGLRPQVVLSSGTLHLLTAEQVIAVLAHEQAHARERHDLVLLPFHALRRLVPRSRLAALASQAVRLLIEMRADEHACRHHDPAALAAALHRLTDLATPAPRIPGTLGITGTATEARLQRISGQPPPLSAAVQWLALTAGAVLTATPITFLVS